MREPRTEIGRLHKDLERLLPDIQGNIVQPHARPFETHLFLGLDSAAPERMRDTLGMIAGRYVTTAEEEYDHDPSRRPQFGSLLFSARGYQACSTDPPTGGAFNGGMASRRDLLHDPPNDEWQLVNANAPVDALIIIADDDEVRLAQSVVEVRTTLRAAGVTVPYAESGRRLTVNSRVVEHFGFVDGISQPIFLPRRWSERSSKAKDEAYQRWDPSAPLDLVLVEEHAGGGHYGSYCVYRKLEQNVRRWNVMMRDYTRVAGIDVDLAGAFSMGRFHDGTPVVLHAAAQDADPPENDFDYTVDPDGRRCPFQAHIRKSNPRGEEHGGSHEESRRRRLARRGNTYGLRPDLHPMGRQLPAPERGVGLLFLCYQASIEDQFEHIQSRWRGNRDYPRPQAGLDALITHTDSSPETETWPASYNSGLTVDLAFERTVRILGGEYFFAPSISFLRSL